MQGDARISARRMQKIGREKDPTRRRVAQPSNNGQYPSTRVFSQLATVTSREAGRAWVFAFALAIIVVWAVTGPLFDFSDTWQLVINTGTTIVTFLMVFLIQNSQNRDAAAIQVKLDELIRVSKVQNSFIGLEHLTEEELEEIRRRCEEAAKAEDRAGRRRA
jgi:low affinity Fe/Cu permease